MNLISFAIAIAKRDAFIHMHMYTHIYKFSSYVVSFSFPNEKYVMSKKPSVGRGKFFLKINYVKTGTIPQELSTSTLLSRFDLGENFMHGTIPNSFGESWRAGMLSFSIDDNAFSGTLPDSISLWRQMTWLQVDTNALTGTVPLSYRSLRDLLWASFDENQLTGTLDPMFCPNSGGDKPLFLIADCGGTDPEIICSCCSTTLECRSGA